ncbi:MAG: GAF domain-containing protein [Candidatus Dormibacterales bacterium]
MTARPDSKDVLLEAGLALASELSLPVVLQRIVDLAAQLTDARYGALGVIGEGGTLVEFITTGISAMQRRKIGAPPRGRGVLGQLIREARPLRLKDISDHPQAVGFPPNHPPMGSFLGAPVRALGRVYGNIYLSEKRGAAEFSAEDEASLLILATQAGVAVANAWLYDEVRSRERWLNSLQDITNQIMAGTAPSALRQTIAEHAQALVGADAATIVTNSETPGELIVTAAAGAQSSELLGETLPSEGSISGAVMREGKPLRLDDVSSDPRAFQPIVRLGRHGAGFFVPLREPGGTTGTLMVANLKGRPGFDQRQCHLIETFAEQASLVIEYNRAQGELQKMGLMEDRERIAKELHDGIIQSLFAVGMGLQGTAMAAGEGETARRIEGAVEELDHVIRDLRNYIFGLRPGILADRQLDQALRELAEQIRSRSDARVEVDIDASLAAALSVRSADIVQFTREALSNAVRHAQPGLIALSLSRDGRHATLTVEDNGRGFDTNGGSPGLGLANMRQRAESLGGRLDVTSKPGRGTRLRVTFPV